MNKLTKMFSILVISLLTFSVYGLACERIRFEDSPFYTCQFSKLSMEQDIKDYRSKGLTLNKAKGNVGEDYVLSVVENGDNSRHYPLGYKVKSVVTFFEEKGCNIKSVLRNKSDNGIDDIFICQQDNQQGNNWIDRSYNPYFHEAKYDANCKLILKNTKSCEQLSFQWLDKNLRELRGRIDNVKYIGLCLPGSEEMMIEVPCNDNACKESILSECDWLIEKLQEGQFSRTASVLCRDGKLKFYNVVGI